MFPPGRPIVFTRQIGNAEEIHQAEIPATLCAQTCKVDDVCSPTHADAFKIQRDAY